MSIYIEKLRELGIPHVRLGEVVNDKIIQAIYEALVDMYDEYPLFKNLIASVATVDDSFDYKNLLEYTNANPQYQTYEEYNDVTVGKSKLDDLTNYAILKFSAGIGARWYYTPNLNNKSFYCYYCLEVCRGTYNQEIEDIESEKIDIYHEFAHILDAMLHISNDPEFLEIIRDPEFQKFISNFKYFSSDREETFAESFALYMIMLGQENLKAINQIGDLVNRRYQEFAKKTSTITFYRYYQLNRPFKIVKRNILNSLRELHEIYQDKRAK